MNFLHKLKETILSIIPLIAIVTLLNFVLMWTGNDSLSGKELGDFFIACALVVAGLTLFLVGVDNSIITMGEMVGGSMIKFKKVFLILAFGFLFGFLCTIAEPDVQVLAAQVNSIDPRINNFLLVCVVGLGVAIFIVLALVKTIFKIKLKVMLLISYIIVFILAAFTPDNFLAMSFDSGGVTTGPITVPFILALCVGVASVRSENNSEDNFGMVALASVGPIMAIMILGLIFGVGGNTLPPTAPESFLHLLGNTFGEVAIAILPITVIFLIFQFFFIKLPKKKLIEILLGALIVFLGLILFLTGVNFGFSSAGNAIGRLTANTDIAWLMIPVGLAIGIATVFTEPAIAVLGDQVEKVTSGNIKKKTLIYSLAIGVGIAVMLAVIKSLFAISLWYFVIPTYAIALLLMLFSPDIFSAIAFDSGGVASGPMTATFTLPLVMGIAEAKNEPVLLYAFGVVALVAVMPPIVIQVLGIMHKLKENRIETMTKSELQQIEKMTEGVDTDTFRSAALLDFDFSGLEKKGWRIAGGARFERRRTAPNPAQQKEGKNAGQ